jgi:hypothetical protein
MSSTSESFPSAETDWNLAKLYQDLAAAKHQFSPHRKAGLTEVEKLHLRGLLCGYSPAEIAVKLVKTTKAVEVDLCNTVYRYVETATGRGTNSLENWRDIVTWLEAAGYKNPSFEQSKSRSIVVWGEAPDVSVFFGREEELSRLKRWTVGITSTQAPQPCRLVAILGMGGIGKTALAAKLAEQVQNQFDYLIWRSLRHASPLEDVLDQWLQVFNPEAKVSSSSWEGKIADLMEYLRRYRCLLVLDNLETVLRSGDFAGHYREGYKSYGELLRRVGEEQHQSCLLLTSREQTGEIAVLDGNNQPVRSLRLEGLQEAAREILKAKDLSEEGQWGTLIKIYRGNPLVLKMVSTTIKEIFDGSVSAFLKQRMTLITGDISDFVRQQFNRLSNSEQKILCQIARTQKPMLIPELKEVLLPISAPDLLRALESLVRRSLIEKSAAGFTLQPVVMEYVSNQLEPEVKGD